MPEKIGFLFPGQGAQYVGMGKDLYENFPTAQRIFNQADKILGFPLSRICMEGPEETLTQTRYAQPAIFVTSIAAHSVLREKFPVLTASFFAGLSLGEFSALVAASAISFDEGLILVDKRAAAMEKCAEKFAGTMASIMGLSQTDCELIAKEAGCEVANLNSPDQIVLSGTQASITTACKIAETKGAKRAIQLKVGGAFHSSLMKEARNELEMALKQTKIEEPGGLFIPNAIGKPVSAPEEIRKLLSQQLTSPVRWIETMDRAKEANLNLFIEIGPGKVLKGLARKCHAELTAVEPCGSAADIQKLEGLFATL